MPSSYNAISTRDEFAEYCLRRLGKGAININVTKEQVQDRINDAIQWMQEYHHNYERKVFLSHQITDEDVSNNYLLLPKNIVSVSRVFGNSVFNYLNQYNQQYLLDLSDAARIDITSYYMAVSSIALIENVVTNQPSYSYQKYDNNKLSFNAKILGTQFVTGEFVAIEAYAKLGPDDLPQMWDDHDLKDLTTAFLKKQWGDNLSKFGDVALPGGITLDGPRILQEAEAEIEKLETDFKMRLQDPDLPDIS